MAWATVQQVQDITRVTVTEADVAAAQFVVELFSEVTEAYTLPARDARYLRMAVAFQAAWLHTQIDAAARTDVSTVTQDEMSFTYATPEAAVLAPLTAHALKRLSWKGTRSVRVRSPEDADKALDPEEAFVTDSGGPPYRPLGI